MTPAAQQMQHWSPEGLLLRLRDGFTLVDSPAIEYAQSCRSGIFSYNNIFWLLLSSSEKPLEILEDLQK